MLANSIESEILMLKMRTKAAAMFPRVATRERVLFSGLRPVNGKKTIRDGFNVTGNRIYLWINVESSTVVLIGSLRSRMITGYGVIGKCNPSDVEYDR